MKKWISGAAVALLGFLLVTLTQAENLKIIHKFKTGQIVAGPIVFDLQGNIYGTSPATGEVGHCCGSVFKLTPNGKGGWTQSTVFAFNCKTDPKDSCYPDEGLTIDNQGNIYGTAAGHNAPGSIFEISASGVFSTLALVENFPSTGVAIDKAGNLFIATAPDWVEQAGKVYRISNVNGQWVATVIYQFTDDQYGCQPGTYGTLAVADSGNIYGTTISCGGQYQDGTIYRLVPDGTGNYTIELLFTNSETNTGGGFYSGLSIDKAGLFGLENYTFCGGNTCGPAVFSFTHARTGQWVKTILHQFQKDDGASYNPITDSAGNRYGTTEFSIYKMALQPDGSYKNSILHKVKINEDLNPGNFPVTIGPDNLLYGIAAKNIASYVLYSLKENQ